MPERLTGPAPEQYAGELPRPGGWRGRRLLLLTASFPPDAAVGSLRWEKLAWPLEQAGIALDALAVHPDLVETPDWDRLAELPPSLRAFGFRPSGSLLGRLHPWLVQLRNRARAGLRGSVFPGRSRRPGTLTEREVRGVPRTPRELARLFFAAVSHSRDRRWAVEATRAGRWLLAGQRYDAVVSSGPPHVAHEAARRLAARAGLPLVVDLRDPWGGQDRVAEPLATRRHYQVTRRLERCCLSEARLVIANTELSRRDLASTYPAWADRLVTVMNGSDADPLPAAPAAPAGRRFVVAYAGTIYLDRDPRPLLRAAGQVIRKLQLSPEEFSLEFMGRVEAYHGVALEAIAREEGAGDHLVVHPPGPRAAALAFLAGASVLVSLPQDSIKSIPAKLFEYVRFPAWVLALTEAGSATAIALRDTTADLCGGGDVEGIARILERRYGEFRRTGRPPPADAAGTLGRGAQAERLVRALEAFCFARPPGATRRLSDRAQSQKG